MSGSRPSSFSSFSSTTSSAGGRDCRDRDDDRRFATSPRAQQQQQEGPTSSAAPPPRPSSSSSTRRRLGPTRRRLLQRSTKVLLGATAVCASLLLVASSSVLVSLHGNTGTGGGSGSHRRSTFSPSPRGSWRRSRRDCVLELLLKFYNLLPTRRRKPQEGEGEEGKARDVRPRKSLHPRWKLWDEMDGRQRHAAMEEIGAYLEKYGRTIAAQKGARGGNRIHQHGTCNLTSFGGVGGVGEEGHHIRALCPLRQQGKHQQRQHRERQRQRQCNFVSVGGSIGGLGGSLEAELAERWNCRGYAVSDPTVSSHSIQIRPLANVLGQRGEELSTTTSLPGLRKLLEVDTIDILKLDCEGCESAMVRDVLVEDPTFLRSVDQLLVVTHASRESINATEDLYHFGLQFPLLEEAGFVLERSAAFGCSSSSSSSSSGRKRRHNDEVVAAGCAPELERLGFPSCGYRPNAVLGRLCHEFLWVREGG